MQMLAPTTSVIVQGHGWGSKPSNRRRMQEEITWKYGYWRLATLLRVWWRKGGAALITFAKGRDANIFIPRIKSNSHIHVHAISSSMFSVSTRLFPKTIFEIELPKSSSRRQAVWKTVWPISFWMRSYVCYDQNCYEIGEGILLHFYHCLRCEIVIFWAMDSEMWAKWLFQNEPLTVDHLGVDQRKYTNQTCITS